MAITNYRELIAWQRAMDFAELVYRATARLPREEMFGLTSQLRRAAVSIPSNIAEWQGRGSCAEFLHGLSIANGSRQEVETQATLAMRLNLLTQETVDCLLTQSAEVGRLISGLARALRTSKNSAPKARQRTNNY